MSQIICQSCGEPGILENPYSLCGICNENFNVEFDIQINRESQQYENSIRRRNSKNKVIIVGGIAAHLANHSQTTTVKDVVMNEVDKTHKEISKLSESYFTGLDYDDDFKISKYSNKRKREFNKRKMEMIKRSRKINRRK